MLRAALQLRIPVDGLHVIDGCPENNVRSLRCFEHEHARLEQVLAIILPALSFDGIDVAGPPIRLGDEFRGIAAHPYAERSFAQAHVLWAGRCIEIGAIFSAQRVKIAQADKGQQIQLDASTVGIDGVANRRNISLPE